MKRDLFSKKLFTIILAFALVISSLVCVNNSNAAGNTKIKKAYKQYLKELKAKKPKKDIYMAIVNTSKEGTPVLLVTDSIINGDSKPKKESGESSHADVYNYVKGKIVYIGKISGTGSGYPIVKDGRYLVTGFHHSSDKMIVSGKKGYVEHVEGFGMSNDDGSEYDKCYKKTWELVNNKIKNEKSEKITQSESEELDYYMTAYDSSNSDRVVTFKKFK